ncbi:MAG: hypothetical protein K6L76_04240 [Agarilytica sp.]
MRKTNSILRLVFVNLILAVILGCASIPPIVERPTFALESVELVSINPFSPAFRVNLRIMNGNVIALPIDAMEYVIAVQGLEIFKGSKRDIPSIPANGEISLGLDVTADTVAALKLIKIFRSLPTNEVNYRLNATIGMAGLLPNFSIEELGTATLGN